MDDEQYKRIFKKARAYAAKRGFGDESDDFAQEYAIKCLKSGIEGRIEWAFIDYSDSQRADKRLLGSPSGYLSKNVTVSFDAPIGGEGGDTSKLSDYIGMSGDDLDNGRYDEQNKQLLTRRESMIYDLHFTQGHTLDSIGNILGVTESRVSQHLKEINRKIQLFYNDGEILNLFLSKIDSSSARHLTINTFKKGIRKNVFKG